MDREKNSITHLNIWLTIAIYFRKAKNESRIGIRKKSIYRGNEVDDYLYSFHKVLKVLCLQNMPKYVLGCGKWGVPILLYFPFQSFISAKYSTYILNKIFNTYLYQSLYSQHNLLFSSILTLFLFWQELCDWIWFTYQCHCQFSRKKLTLRRKFN